MNIGPLHIDRRAGRTVEHYGQQITPESLVARLEIPGLQGGVIFNTPIGVRVAAPDQPPRTLPVVNYNRLGQFAFMGIALFAVILIAIWRKS